MKRLIGVGAGIIFGLFAWHLQAAVILNEVFINPAGSLDNTQEFIELMGPPGMKLDGYAVAFANGTTRKYYELNSVPPTPSVRPEIDEFMSLDGLQLGANGILVLGRGSQGNYGTLLTDSLFRTWSGAYPTGLWNGFLDTPGGLDNDGSNTVLLIRHRPGATSGGGPVFNPPPDLRWGKDIQVDAEIIKPVDHDVCSGGPIPGEPCSVDGDCAGGTCVPGQVTQLGDSSIDKGSPIGGGESGNTLDMKGESTLEDPSDDLEVVDEVSYEDGHGFEYDVDDRHVDIGSTSIKFETRHVHQLGDPHGFNPDCLTRVDYRTKGDGWAPVSGATGEMANGNNWQDTATEQWIRGENVTGSGGVGANPQLFYDNTANLDPDAVQPYMINVPLWLNDGSGADFNFATANSYQIMAGRVNPLAITFVPGDVDRDGDCDADDIAKMAAVFGNDDWIFSNSFMEAPESNDGDPATQTRPWDVDLTGNNGIEASDMQWVLNFQGNTNGHVVGVRYDSTTPAATGVTLNSNAGVTCTVTWSTSVLSGRPLSGLKVGDTIEITVSAQVTGGANNTASQENGVMQFVQDLAISAGSVARVTGIQSLGSFSTTRSGIQLLQGTNGDLGVNSINGYATSFTQGLGSTAAMYRVTLRAAGLGSANVSLAAATLAKFAASTPQGLKVGHTNNNGNPTSASYPAAIALTVTTTVKPDFDLDGDVDSDDFDHFVACATRASVPQTNPVCLNARLDGDTDVDMDDFAIYQRCYSGVGGIPDPNCDVP